MSLNTKHVEYDGHSIHVYRDWAAGGDWYIVCILPDGTYGYDGFWRDSITKTADDAIAEAKRGACLPTRPAQENAP